MADRSEIDTGTGEVLVEIRDRVALLTLNRPEARNALSDHLTPARRLSPAIDAHPAILGARNGSTEGHAVSKRGRFDVCRRRFGE
jgi:hypothetical protein